MGATRPFQGTWVSASAVDFGPRPSESPQVRSVLSDGRMRTVTGILSWLAANGVADLGYDELASQGNSKWLYFYAVPATGDDATLTVVASDNDPSVGPAERSAWKHVWMTYVDSGGNLLHVDQRGNTFTYQCAQQALSLGVGDPDEVASLDLSAFVPWSATFVELLLYYQAKGTRGKLILWVDGEAGSGDVGDPSLDNNDTWHVRAVNADNTFGSDSCHATIPLRNLSLQYQPKSGCNVALVHVAGWIDGSVEDSGPSHPVNNDGGGRLAELYSQ